MPAYAIGDQIELSAELGSTRGTITQIEGGPQGAGSVRISCTWGAETANDGALAVLPDQVAALIPPPPVFTIGQAVTLATRPGTIVDIDGDGICTVEVEVNLTKLRGRGYMGSASYIRLHRVPHWRLSLEN